MAQFALGEDTKYMAGVLPSSMRKMLFPEGRKTATILTDSGEMLSGKEFKIAWAKDMASRFGGSFSSWLKEYDKEQAKRTGYGLDPNSADFRAFSRERQERAMRGE